jgi:hypothetical protein
VFKQGATAEEIVYRYPSLKLADLYAAIGFYLNHLDTFPVEIMLLESLVSQGFQDCYKRCD